MVGPQNPSDEEEDYSSDEEVIEPEYERPVKNIKLNEGVAK